MRDSRFAEPNAWEQHATPEEIRVASINGRAIAEGPPDVALLQKAEEALGPGLWHAFHEELVVAACENAARRAAWTSALQNAFEASRKSLSTSFADKRDQRQLEAASQDWQGKRDPFSVWSSRDPHLSHGRRDLWSLGKTLLQIAPLEGLRAMESLPHPSLMKEILHVFCREDRSLIESLIQAAPSVFDTEGMWNPERGVAALLVIDLVTKHAEVLHDKVSLPMRLYGSDDDSRAAAQRALDDLEKRELPDWMLHAFGSILQRPDGQKVALGYLAHLCRERLLGRGQRQAPERWSVSDAALVALAAALRQRSIGVASAREVWSAAEQLARAEDDGAAKRNSVRRRSARANNDFEGEGARSLRAEGLPLLHGAAMIVGDAATASSADLALFWSWLDELLVGRDPGLSLIHHGTSMTDVPQHFGFLLSRLPEPHALLRKTYGKLEPQRRRALFAHRYEEIHYDLESVFLLRVGLNAVVNWHDHVKEGDQAEAARDLFFWIYEAACRLWLTAVLDTGDTKRQLVVVCHAFMPFLFAKEIGNALKRTIPHIMNDARTLADACSSLRLNGLEAERVRKLAADADADLVAALLDVHQWSELTEREEDFPEHLQKLASELGLAIKSPASR